VFRTLAGLAAAHHGALSVAAARSAGLTAKAQRGAEQRGELVQIHPNVIVIGGAPRTWRQQLHAGSLALSGRGWVSHRAAAQLHGFDRFVHDVVEFTVDRTARQLTTVGRLHTTERVGPLDLVTVEDLRCTSATRTILDLAAIGIAESSLAAAIDSAVRLRLSAPVAIEHRLAELRLTTQRGARALDVLLMDSGGESILERAFLRLLRRAGLPRPETQVVHRHGGEHVARVDFLFRAQHIVVEVTGQHGHSSPSERTKDAHRRNELLDLGYRMYEYTWFDVTRRPAYVADTMRARLAAAMSPQ
jgi:very-short-patch-repair endonuclease